MSPRLEAVARYHRHYRRLIRESGAFPPGVEAGNEYLRMATIAYRAMAAEVSPQTAPERKP